MKINATIQDIKSTALLMLRGRWGSAVLLTLFYILFSGVTTALSITLAEQQTLLLALTVVLTFVECFLDLGVRYGMLQCSRGIKPSVGCVFDGGAFYFRSLLYYLPLNLLSYGFSHIGTRLMEQPGNLVLIALALAFGGLQLFFQLSFMPMLYLVMDNPSIGVGKLFGDAWRSMRGNRVKFLLLHLSFFGWILLVTLFFGFGMLFLLPYMYVAECVFYQLLLPQEEVAPSEEKNNQQNT